MLTWIKGLFSKAYRRISTIIKAVRSFIFDHWHIIEYAIMVVKEIELYYTERPGYDKARLAFERIMEEAEKLGWITTKRWVNFAIELACLILKDTDIEE